MNANSISHHLFVAALSNDVRATSWDGAAPGTNGNGAETGTRVSRQLARALAAAESGRAARLRLRALSLERASGSGSNP